MGQVSHIKTMDKLIRITGIRIAAALLSAMITIAPALGQIADSEHLSVVGAAGFSAGIPANRSNNLVEVDWFEEILEGGFTMVFLGLLSIALGAFLIERFLTLRRKNFVPPGLITAVRPLFLERRFDEILAICAGKKSVMADIIVSFVELRAAGFEILSAGAADIGTRAVIDQEEKCAPLSVIAGVAPLMGLLGTMIGMIEAFKLVEVFGDEGGASLLAGSISKALITTAVGLVLAIPAILGFYWAKRRVHQVSTWLETETEDLLKLWFLSENSAPEKQLSPLEHSS